MKGRVRTLFETHGRTLVMGISNRTPDSFSDGGLHLDEAAALDHAERMIADGADIIDVGAESTRPGAPPVAAAEQIRRLGAMIATLTKRGVPCSIDTTAPEVARTALEQGACIVNLVDPSRVESMAAAARPYGADLLIMHCRGAMQAMSGFSRFADDAYSDVTTDVARELSTAADLAIGAGLDPGAIVLDPGLGFAKNARHSLALSSGLAGLVALGYPVVYGASRKSFLRAACEERGVPAEAPQDRVGASVAAALFAADQGVACVRVHDVLATRQAIAMTHALRGARAMPASPAPPPSEAARA